MTNAILLNQSTEMTKENVLEKIDTDLVSAITKNSSNSNNNLTLELQVTTLPKDGGATTSTTIDLDAPITTYVTAAIQSALANAVFISTTNDLSYEAVTS